MTPEEDDPMVACESADEEDQDEGREARQEEDPAPEEAGYSYGV